MWNSNLNNFITVCFILCFGLPETNSAQTSKNDFLPKYPVKSAVINYQIQNHQSNDTLKHPFLRESFDLYGALISKEFPNEATFMIHGELYRVIFKNGSFYTIGYPKGCATKKSISAETYMISFEGGFIKMAQDLIHGRINKSNDKAFQSFTKTGTVTFLELECSTYEYRYSNFAFGSTDRYLFIIYHDICLSSKLYFMGNLLSTIEATSFEENSTIPTSVFEIPETLRIIDGDMLEVKNEKATCGFSTLIVDYQTHKNYGQVKEEGKKTLYIRDNGKSSVQDWKGTKTEYQFPPETSHWKKIQDDEYEYFVNFEKQSSRRRNLVNDNYHDKSIAELNYLFENILYDNSVKLIGETSFLGKNCHIFKIRIGVEELEVYEWQGVFLKIKGFICINGDDCPEPILVLEETATQIRENAPVSNSMFEVPETFELLAD